MSMLKGVLLPILLVVISLIWISRLKKKLQYHIYLNKLYQNERLAVISFLHKMGESLTSSFDLEKTLSMIGNFILKSIGAESGAVFLRTQDGQALCAKVVLGLFPPLYATSDYVFTRRKFLVERIKKDRIKLGEGILGQVALTGESKLIKNAINDPQIPKTAKDFISIESIMVVPLRVKEKILGVIAVVNKNNNQRFTEEDMRLLQALSDQAALTVDIVQLYDEVSEKKRIEQELKIAQEFQKLLLPKEFPKIPGFDIAAYSQPALEVGGDYYDFIWIDENHLGVVIADVSGKGIPGALVMAMVRCVLRAECANATSTIDILKRVNERIFQDIQENVFITMTFAILDIDKRIIRFCRAGHEPIIMMNEEKNDLSISAPDGIALGLADGELLNIMKEQMIKFNDNDIMIFYTDGVIEAMDEKQQEYGQERFFNVLKGNRKESPEQIIKTVLEDIQTFTHKLPQHDDITLVAIKSAQKTLVTMDKDSALNASA